MPEASHQALSKLPTSRSNASQFFGRRVTCRRVVTEGSHHVLTRPHVRRGSTTDQNTNAVSPPSVCCFSKADMLCATYPADLLTSYPVTPKMNRASFNEPEAIAPLAILRWRHPAGSQGEAKPSAQAGFGSCHFARHLRGVTRRRT